MKRGIVLSGVILVGALSLLLAAAQGFGAQQQAPRVIEVQKVKDNLFVLRGGGGNTAVFVMANGVMVVDAKLPGWGQPILDKIKTLTDKPVIILVNTHSHFDHVSGNVEFPSTVDIVAQENTKANMRTMVTVTGPGPQQPGNIFRANNFKGLPKRTFKDRMSIGRGDDRVDLYYFGRGHTNGDAWVVFPFHRTMHTGDIFAGKGLPLFDANNGSSGIAYSDTLQRAYDTLTNVDTIIPGHAPTQMTRADLKEFATFNRDFLNYVREAKKAGKTLDEVASTWKVPPQYTGYAAAREPSVKSNAQVIYDELGSETSSR